MKEFTEEDLRLIRIGLETVAKCPYCPSCASVVTLLLEAYFTT